MPVNSCPDATVPARDQDARLHDAGVRAKVEVWMEANMQKVTAVKVLEDYRLDLVFADGKRGIVDLSHLVGKGVFALWDDYRAFRDVRVGTSGELAWGEEVDLCPDALYMQATEQKPEDVFPSLRHEPIHA